MLLLTSCALQPVSEPRRVDFSAEPTLIPPLAEQDKPTYEVQRGPVVETLTLPGRVGSAIEQSLLADRDGTISTVLIRDGDTVIAGDIIALLDSRDLDEQIDAAKRRLAAIAAEAQLLVEASATEQALAELRIQRANLALEAAEEAGITDTQRTLLETDIQIAELELASLSKLDVVTQEEQLVLEQQMVELRAELDTRRLVAAADGDLIGSNLRVGQRVQAGSVLGSLINRDTLLVWADANAGEMARLAEGMPVDLSLPANSGATFDGEIVHLPFPEGSGSVREDGVGVSSAELPPLGDRVDMAIVLSEQADALWLPPAALREFAGQPFVVVREGDSERRADVTLGLTSPGRVEIVSGLTEGELVVAP